MASQDRKRADANTQTHCHRGREICGKPRGANRPLAGYELKCGRAWRSRAAQPTKTAGVRSIMAKAFSTSNIALNSLPSSSQNLCADHNRPGIAAWLRAGGCDPQPFPFSIEFPFCDIGSLDIRAVGVLRI